MCMFKKIAMTNRKISKRPLVKQIAFLIEQGIDTFILREKDLSKDEYIGLAREVLAVCMDKGANLILHNFVEVGKIISCKSIHLPLDVLINIPKDTLDYYDIIGCSCHSIEEGILAQNLGATYISIGNIFETSCKNGLKGKGTELIIRVKDKVEISVYGLGGINSNNIDEIVKSGADGAIIMSGYMEA